jgi:hypothetical protein
MFSANIAAKGIPVFATNCHHFHLLFRQIIVNSKDAIKQVFCKVSQFMAYSTAKDSQQSK